MAADLTPVSGSGGGMDPPSTEATSVGGEHPPEASFVLLIYTYTSEVRPINQP